MCPLLIGICPNTSICLPSANAEKAKGIAFSSAAVTVASYIPDVLNIVCIGELKDTPEGICHPILDPAPKISKTLRFPVSGVEIGIPETAAVQVF